MRELFPIAILLLAGVALINYRRLLQHMWSAEGWSIRSHLWRPAMLQLILFLVLTIAAFVTR